MNGAEFEKALKMLRAYWPKSEKFRNQESTYAWYLALKPYAYDDVRQSIINVARAMRYPPDPVDIIKALPQPEKSAEADVTIEAWMLPYIAKDDPSRDGSVSRYAREHGVSWEQAEKEMKGARA